MSIKNERMQRIFRYYRDQHGRSAADTRVVVEWAVKRGLLQMPRPVDPYDVLAHDMSSALREEMRVDPSTGLSYRVNHAVVGRDASGVQHTIWDDIDEAPRSHMQKAFTQRREQIVGDCFQLKVDVEHYNTHHRDERSIQMPLDFTADVAERMIVAEPISPDSGPN
jgi:hypothetical protein